MGIIQPTIKLSKGKFIIISGPSGAGKTSVVNEITKNRLITSTTREPREGEVHGTDYYFISHQEFEELIQGDLLIEWAKYGKFDNLKYYGLTRKELDKKMQIGNVFAIVDVQGMKKYKELFPEAVSIFIYASYESVKQQLVDRGDCDVIFQERLSLYKQEIAIKDAYDYSIENKYGEFEKTIKKIKNLII